MCKSNKIKCPRCNGNGEVEHTHVVYGVCFMCKGSGEVFQERVEELTEKAKKRKANIEKRKAEKKESEKILNEQYWSKVYNEVTNRNIEFIENYKCRNTDVIKQFFIKVKGISKALNINSESSEKEVRDMFERFFENETFKFRFEISKYTQKFHNFCFVDVNGKNSDFTESMHEIQNLIKR